MLIDGSSQPGYAGTPLIALSSQSPGVSDVLSVSGGTVTVHGLAIGRLAITTTTDELLIALVHGEGVTTRLSLLDAQGQVLVQSDGLSPSNPDGQIDEHLPAGTYYIEVDDTSGVGDMTLTANLTPASGPYQPLAVQPAPFNAYLYDPLAVGDFNGDGIPDLAEPDGVHLGVGDGTFQNPLAGLGLPALTTRLRLHITSMVAGDFTGDGKLDLAIADTGDGVTDFGGVFILLGNGNGTFQAPEFYPTGTYAVDLVAGDFSGNGRLDLAVAGDFDGRGLATARSRC